MEAPEGASVRTEELEVLRQDSSAVQSLQKEGVQR